MDTTDPQVLPAPPSLIRSLMAGFDAISNHVGLIVFSIGLDLLLWLGPHLRLSDMISSFFNQAARMPEMSTPEMAQMMRASREMWQGLAERFNLLSVLRTFPVGIPSLMMGRSPVNVPGGQPLAWEVPGLGAALLLWLALVVFGLVAGTLYFSTVSQAATLGKIDWLQSLRQWPWESYQVICLALFWLGLLLLASLPFTCLISILLAGGLSLGKVGILVYGGFLVWLLLPLVFSPHGIFISRLKMWASVKEGLRLTRLTFPSTSLFILSIFVLSEGLDLLWEVPAETSWWTFVGVAGHAFITTCLLAASFIYYQDAEVFIQHLVQRSKWNAIGKA